MDLSFGRHNTFFIVFIIGVLLSYGIFTFVQQSDRRAAINNQLDDVEEQLVRVEVIHTNCVSLHQSRERTPQPVREACASSQAFVSWARTFPFDSKLKSVEIELLALAAIVEDLSRTLSLHPNAARGQELLDLVPIQINTVREEASRASRRILF